MSWWSRLFGRDSMGPEEARRRVARGAFLIDVRSASEVGAHPVVGAVNIPLGELAGRVDEIPRDREVLTLCHSGVRSAVAVGRLAQAGIPARSVRGGTLRYRG
jgi:rhodanese-related sulfurtransferase